MFCPLRKEIVLEKILKMYVMAMASDVRSPVPHIVGPPGCGKSESVERAAELLGVNLHIVNVSRINPLELEGYQMPVDDNTQLRLLTATLWKNLKEGDIVLLDEFLRGFPEVYNGLLDIMTSHNVAGFQLPKVFFIAASNTVVAYDKALEDRLLHLPVTDPRKHVSERRHIAQILVNDLGLLPDMATSTEMTDLIQGEILPMYELLDQFKKRANIGVQNISGCSVRNLKGQVKLREVQSNLLKELLLENNRTAMRSNKAQYVVLLSEKYVTDVYKSAAAKLVKMRDKLTPIQQLNLDCNLQLIGLAEARDDSSSTHTESEDEDDNIFL